MLCSDYAYNVGHWHPAKGKVVPIDLPAQAKPGAKDYIAVVKSAPHPAAARAFVAMILSQAGQAKLRAAGFGAP